MQTTHLSWRQCPPVLGSPAPLSRHCSAGGSACGGCTGGTPPDTGRAVEQRAGESPAAERTPPEDGWQGPGAPGPSVARRTGLPERGPADATQGITKAARGLGGRYPLGSSERTPRPSLVNRFCKRHWVETQDTQLPGRLARGSVSGRLRPCLHGVSKRPVRRAATPLPKALQSSLQVPRPGLQPAGGGRSLGTSPHPPLPSPQCPGPSGCTAARPQWAPRAAAEPWVRGHKELGRASVGDRDQLGRKLPWHSSLPRRLPRWHSAAPLSPTDPLSLQIHST